jgi:hypothetical protein
MSLISIGVYFYAKASRKVYEISFCIDFLEIYLRLFDDTESTSDCKLYRVNEKCTAK